MLVGKIIALDYAHFLTTPTNFISVDYHFIIVM